MNAEIVTERVIEPMAQEGSPLDKPSVQFESLSPQQCLVVTLSELDGNNHRLRGSARLAHPTRRTRPPAVRIPLGSRKRDHDT